MLRKCTSDLLDEIQLSGRVSHYVSKLSSPFRCSWSLGNQGGNALEGDLTVYFDGKRASGYAPMKKQGAIILGIGGDNSEGAVGTFYEGAMIRGYTTDATDNAIQANVVAAAYGS